MAMFPALSRAALDIHRCMGVEDAGSSANVPDWYRMGVVKEGWLRTSYQRMPARLPPVLLTLTVWVTTRDSWSPKFRYSRRFMRRSDRVSSRWLVPGWGTQLP